MGNTSGIILWCVFICIEMVRLLFCRLVKFLAVNWLKCEKQHVNIYQWFLTDMSVDKEKYLCYNSYIRDYET